MATAASVTPKKGNMDNLDEGRGKRIRDPVHGLMFFREPVVVIIDTVEVQRLREIRQLGATYLVYPGASHNRFDHALGTAYLCGEMLQSLKDRDPDNRITDHNILLVQIAGLCHDLGQGPFSRVYKHTYLGKIKQRKWNQKEIVLEIFQSIIEKEKVKKVFEKYNIDGDDINFIKHAMTGEIPPNPKKDRFLYEIVRNKKTGLDCNMFDTLIRDAYFLGISICFDYKLYIIGSSINKVNNEYRLCLRHKEEFEWNLFFHSLWILQHKAYVHKTTTAIEMMLAEVLHEAEDVFHIFEARNNTKLLLTLTDNIITRIEYDEDERLTKAKEIIQRIKERQLYKFCGQTSPPDMIKEDKKHDYCKDVVKEIISKAKGKDEIEEEDILIDIVAIDYGIIGSEVKIEQPNFVNKYGKPVTSKCKSFSSPISPVSSFSTSNNQDGSSRSKEHTRGSFSGKENAEESTYEMMKDLQIAGHMQHPIKAQFIRAYARNERKKDAIINRFYAWCVEKEYPIPVDNEKIAQEHEDNSDIEMSSVKRKLEF